MFSRMKRLFVVGLWMVTILVGHSFRVQQRNHGVHNIAWRSNAPRNFASELGAGKQELAWDVMLATKWKELSESVNNALQSATQLLQPTKASSSATTPKPNLPLVNEEEEKRRKKALELQQCNDEIATYYQTVAEVVQNRQNKIQPAEIINAMQKLEGLMRKRNQLDEGITSITTLQKLGGCWQLYLTANNNKNKNQVIYFPLKAVQCFNDTTMELTNSIYIFNNFAVIQFAGRFDWNDKIRKLSFDFDELRLFNKLVKIPFNRNNALEFGARTGLAGPNSKNRFEVEVKDNNENNMQSFILGKKKVKRDPVKPFFNWILVNDDIAMARGAGGGLAIWKRYQD